MSAWLEVARDRASEVPRWRISAVVMAAVVLALPYVQGGRTRYHGLTYAQITFVAFVGAFLAWLFLDRLMACRTARAVAALAAIAIAVVVFVAATLVLMRPAAGRAIAIDLAVASVGGAMIRGIAADRRSMGSLVALAAMASWLGYDLAKLDSEPLRDFHLYLGAGATVLKATSPYLHAPLTSVPDPTKLPFVYPPLTVPIFAALATLPRTLADVVWVGGSLAAVVAAFWLLGVRGRWLVILLAWPAPALGIQVGNVASYTFFLYVLGFRVGTAIVLSGMFKVQSAAAALWLVRERRWRSIAIGAAILAAMALLALPLLGPRAWVDWANGLKYFQEGIARHPSMQVFSVYRYVAWAGGIAITVLAVAFAWIARGRNSLARFGIAAIVASPTTYFHALSPLLAGVLILGPECLWFVLGLGPWSSLTVWSAVILVALALLAAGRDLTVPDDLSPARADISPAARAGQVWPDPA